MIAVETMETVSRSSNKIFIFADGVPEALSPAETIFEMYPDTACTTSMANIAKASTRAGSQDQQLMVISSGRRPGRPNRLLWMVRWAEEVEDAGVDGLAAREPCLAARSRSKVSDDSRCAVAHSVRFASVAGGEVAGTAIDLRFGAFKTQEPPARLPVTRVARQHTLGIDTKAAPDVPGVSIITLIVRSAAFVLNHRPG